MELRDDDFYDETELGWEMLGLKRAHEAFIAQNTSDNYVDLKSAVFSVVTEYYNDPKSEQARDFPVFFLSFWAEVQKEPFYPEDYCNELDVFIELLIKSGNIGAILDTPHKHNILACACHTRVYACEQGAPHPANYHIGQILEIWLGKKVNIDQLDDTVEFSDLLYSPAALALYNGDISDLKNLPRELFNEGFPVAALTSAQPVAIPRDIA